MQIIRRSSFVSTPWKNGGGITHEAIRVPSTGTVFRWRVSVAEIEASGPFSDFADYNRTMVLLRGSGVRLLFRGGRPIDLRAAGDLVEFDGGIPTDCELLSGPCTDLNLMVSKSMSGTQAWVRPLLEPYRVESSRPGTMLVLPISGALSVDGARGRVHMGAWDLAVVSPGERGTFEPEALTPDPLVFFATFDDNSP